MTDAEVIIVGGGLAGSALALGLARRGITAIVVDKRDFPRDKPCGEGLLPHGAARLADLGLGDVVRACGGQPFCGILFRGWGTEARGDFEGGARGHGVRRLLLDEHVHKAALAAPGIGFVRGEVRRLAAHDGGMAIELADGRRLTGRIVAGADGPRSIVRREAGLDLGAPERGRYAVRQHFELARGVPLPERVEVSFQGGHELYLTPCGPSLVGVAALCEKAVFSDGSGSRAERLAALLARAPGAVRARLEGARPASEALACGPLRVRARAVARGRVLLVGDAAGYVDAITGEGMSLALGTAAFAADAIAGCLREGLSRDRALAAYARRRARLFRGHAIATHAVVAMARRPAIARRVLSGLSGDPALFSRLLSVSHGARGLWSIGPIQLIKLLIGAPQEVMTT